jgi:hypothetical protein
MSWLEELHNELTARGVAGRRRERILAELGDHIACEPGCEERLGPPAELAARFADELGTDMARRSAFMSFAALALAAAVLLLSQLVTHSTGRYPGFNRGHSLLLFIPAALGMILAPQLALAGGLLAAWRAIRRRSARVLPAAEVALINRRAHIGLLAGLVTVMGIELYVVDFSSVLPGWRVATASGLAACAAVALLASMRAVRRAGGIVSEQAGGAGDLFDDVSLPGSSWLRAQPWRLGGAASIAAALATTLFEWHAERSLAEGLQRGVTEGVVVAVGFALFGRAVGVVAQPEPEPELAEPAG